jgi:predicted transcriptional regulator
MPLRIKLEKEHHDRLVRYAEFMESSADHIIEQALDFVIRKDKEFTAVEAGERADKPKPTRGKRPQAGAAE